MRTNLIVALSAPFAMLASACADSRLPVASEAARSDVFAQRLGVQGQGEQACVAPPNGILAWWPMDGDGTELIAGRDVSVHGTGTFESGVVGEAFAPDVYSPAVGPRAPDLYQQEMTISGWVRLDAYNATVMPVIWTGAPSAADISQSFAIGISGRQVYFIVGDGFRRDIVYTSATVPLGSPVHIAATFDGSALKVYLNGTLDAWIPQTVTSYTSPHPVNIGAIDNRSVSISKFWLNGVIDEIVLYERALEAEEILSIHKASEAGICKAAFVDTDDDGVSDAEDMCPDTDVPERSVPTRGLEPNHFALMDGDALFDTLERGRGKGPDRSYSIEETAGCSCEQIIDVMGLGNGHRKHGCSIGAMDDWVRSKGR